MPSAVRPLSARTYLLRNPRRVVPIALVQAMVTALLVTIITPTNVFETTSEAYVRVLDRFTVVTPMLRSDFDEDLLRVLDGNAAMERRVRAKVLWVRTPMIVGDAYSPVVALAPEEQARFLEQVGNRLVEGALPEPGTPGAALHVAVLQAKGMRLGDAFGQLVDPDDSTPGRFQVVGAIDGPTRVGVADLGYASIPDFVLARREAFQAVIAKPGRKEESDRYLHAALDARERKAFRVIDDDYARSRARRALRNLPLLLGFLTGAVACVVALVTTLLNVITFQARVDEFGLLLAVGHSRGRLVRKLVTEALVVSTVGWAAGLVLGMALLEVYRLSALEPKGILMRVLDVRPLALSVAIPVLSAGTSAVALAARLRRMDPVAVIQRRGA